MEKGRKIIAKLWRVFLQLLKLTTISLRMAWYLFPAVLILFAAYFCFWHLSQGKDVLISSLEKKNANWVVLLSLIFWVLVTWYTGRILVFHKIDLYKSSKLIGFHAPRLMGFLGFSIIWLAYLQLPNLTDEQFSYQISAPIAAAFLWLGTPLLYTILYLIFKQKRVYYFWNIERAKAPAISFAAMEKARKKAYLKIFWTLRIALLFIFAINILWDGPTLLFFSIIVLQIMYLFAIIWRRGALLFEKMPTLFENKTSWASSEGIDWQQLNVFQKAYYTIFYYANISKKERGFFAFFNLITSIAICFYLRAIFVMEFASEIGTLPFVLLAFAVLVGFFALISILSVITKINFHLLLFALIIILGITREPHYVRAFSASTTALLKQRPTLKKYFLQWASERKSTIQNKKNYPAFFILSDGGASRSGYWTAAALGKIEDQTKGGFSSHLFCLSGTSGGGIGVGVFFALLSEKQKMIGNSYENRAKEFLKNDFLTYTLTRMLGPDFFRTILPMDLKTVTDRAGALEKAMECGVDDTVFLKNKLTEPFSKFITDSQHAIQLPILFINTTRIQDGRPGVITNVNLTANAEAFGKRVDVLNIMANGTDMHLSTALVMGARFPYLSPAGRIDQHLIKKDTSQSDKDSIKAHYFVDGGYFDNSGAGVVNEMIIEIKRLMDSLIKIPNDTNYAYLKKIDFYVIHATNSPLGDAVVREIHPIKNDLLAPILTIVGAYNTQTDINNLRLRRYMQSMYLNNEHYKNVDLYNNIRHDTLSFPMNWTISNYYLKRMNRQLDTSRQITRLISWLQTAVN